MIGTTVAFMSVLDLAEYLCLHKNKEVGFTSDTMVDILVYDYYPSEWYGVAITDMFNSDTVVFGYYGDGIDLTYNVEIEEEVIASIIEYFKIQFGMKIDEEYKVCVFKEDLED